MKDDSHVSGNNYCFVVLFCLFVSQKDRSQIVKTSLAKAALMFAHL